jgi:glutamyl-Q tRNA(Asp) synthetase
MKIRTRFAPSPTGPLHLGHAYSALVADEIAQDKGGVFLLRIEDIDQTRSRPEWEAQIYDDLAWLGLRWPEPVMRQSQRGAAYQEAIERLIALGVVYPCSCNRKDISAAMGAPQEGVPQFGPDGQIYPGTCRASHIASTTDQDALRLNMRAALDHVKTAMRYEECLEGAGVKTVDPDYLISNVGDIILKRRDFLASYHLAVVLDDAVQGVTDVVRGADLAEATVIHVLLQHLLGLPTP